MLVDGIGQLLGAARKMRESEGVAIENDDGRITLRGRVLPIGGLKEKLLAAHRQGIREVVLPADNEKDLPDIPENVRNEMKLHFVQSMDEVLKLALEKEIEMAPITGMLNAAEIVARSREEKVTH